jgi:hypothetical protein
MTHGGKRPNAGRKKKFPGVDAVRVVIDRKLPKEWADELRRLVDEWIRGKG